MVFNVIPIGFFINSTLANIVLSNCLSVISLIQATAVRYQPINLENTMLRKNAVALLIASCLSVSAFAADSYTVDPTHTYAHFTVSHFGYSTMHGRFDQSAGKVTLDTAAKTGTVDITIQAASVSTGYGKRDDHLRSPDFFNAAEFPTITYKAGSGSDSPASGMAASRSRSTATSRVEVGMILSTYASDSGSGTGRRSGWQCHVAVRQGV